LSEVLDTMGGSGDWSIGYDGGLQNRKARFDSSVPRCFLSGTHANIRSRMHPLANNTSGPSEPRKLRGAENWRAPEAATYCYLLGCYLGDGNILHRPPNGWTLRIAADQRYEEIRAEILTAMAITFPGRQPRCFARSRSACYVLQLSHPAIGCAFPQHGPGHKHLRKIALEDWQLSLTTAHPDSLIRGLIHSDGCRCVNRFRTKLPSGRVASYSYIRYFFSNLSPDIRQIFQDHCDLLGIRVTQPNHRNLAVSHRTSVAILERLVGPKL
jgi:hypothetical protein